jgi:peptide/nickel transport system substrate-binding protein
MKQNSFLRTNLHWSTHLALVMLLIGCGSDPTSRQGSSSPGFEQSQGSAPKGKAAPYLTYALPSDIQTMDPALIYDVETATVAQHVYRTLVKFAPDSVEIMPDAAESWIISPDGKEYTFRLRAGMTFEDGTPLDSNSVRFSIERQTNPRHPAHVPGRMRYAGFLFGDATTSESALLQSIQTPDPQTIQLRLSRPHGPFLRNLAMGAAAIVNPFTFAEGTSSERMNGAGPYRMKLYRPNEVIILERNRNYLGPASKTSEIRFRVIRDSNIRLAALLKGDADVVGHLDPTALSTVAQDAATTVLAQPSFSLNYLSINHARPPFDRLEVRQALALSIDRRSICEKLYEGQGVPAAGIIPARMLGFANLPLPLAPDPAKAKQLLTQAGFPDGIDVAFTTQDRPRMYNPAGARLAEALQQQLATAGFRVKLETTEFATFLNRVNAKDYTLANSGWVTDNGDPDNFLFELVGREDNNMNYKNQTATKLMRMAASEPDEHKRAELYRQAERLVAADIAIIPISYGKQVLAHRLAVQGLTLHPTGCTQLQEVWISR